MLNCALCEEINGNVINIKNTTYSKLISLKKTIIYSSSNFLVLPSLGALNMTHVLIVPKVHVLSFSKLSKKFDKEVEEIIDKLNSYNKKKSNKKLIFFEHGTGFGCDTSGACISHAHIHAITEVNDFSKLLTSNLKIKKLKNYSDIHNSSNDLAGYILYKDENQNYWIQNSPNLPSQYFRKKYSEASKLNINWNWRQSPNINIIEEVIEYYKDL